MNCMGHGAGSMEHGAWSMEQGAWSVQGGLLSRRCGIPPRNDEWVAPRNDEEADCFSRRKGRDRNDDASTGSA
jgi:hypothetical protein